MVSLETSEIRKDTRGGGAAMKYPVKSYMNLVNLRTVPRNVAAAFYGQGGCGGEYGAPDEKSGGCLVDVTFHC